MGSPSEAMFPRNTAKATPEQTGNELQLSSSPADNLEIAHNSAPAQALCVLGVDPGISGAIAFFFPVAPDRVAAEDMPAVCGEVDAATLAARIIQMAPAFGWTARCPVHDDGDGGWE
jgi:hypothetical protein